MFRPVDSVFKLYSFSSRVFLASSSLSWRVSSRLTSSWPGSYLFVSLCMPCTSPFHGVAANGWHQRQPSNSASCFPKCLDCTAPRDHHGHRHVHHPHPFCAVSPRSMDQTSNMGGHAFDAWWGAMQIGWMREAFAKQLGGNDVSIWPLA